MVMKKHMLPETGQMFEQCIHAVTVRDGVDPLQVYAWLRQTIDPTENGFQPWVRYKQVIKFLRSQDAVSCALKWA